MTGLAIFSDKLFLEHDTGHGHPETPGRLSAILEKLKKQSYFSEILALERRFATVDEVSLIHLPEHFNSVEEICSGGGGNLDADTPVSKQSFEVAKLAVGAGLNAADKIVKGEIKRAVLLLRPPGHHALKERAMGFCIFNNIAICAKYLQKLGLKKIAILDWDVHHGNGTEEAFYEDGTVLFISLHQYPFYPGSGSADEIGRGAGEGFNLNLPIASGSGDADYRKIFERSVMQAIEKFEPEILLISNGMDAHKNDPLGGIELSTKAFEWLSIQALKLADDYCSGRIISFLEGGYNLDAIADATEAHVAVMM